MKRTILSSAAAALAAAALSLAHLSCGGGGKGGPAQAGPIAVSGLALSRNTMTLAVGDATGTLVPAVFPRDAADRAVSWATSDPAVATVADGVVAPVGAGLATITATSRDGAKAAECSVEVVDAPIPAVGAYLDKNELALAEGGTGALALSFIPARATNQNVSWQSSDTAVATVDANGAITAKAEGAAEITAAYQVAEAGTNAPIYGGGGKVRAGQLTVSSATLKVAPKSQAVAATGVEMDLKALEISVGGSGLLFPTVLPANATNVNVSFSSGDPKVASVSSLGVVTGKGAGRATITVTTENGGFRDTCAVTVADAPISPAGVSLNKTALELGDMGEAERLVATVSPNSATDKSLYWFSSDSAVAAVNANGTVQARGRGAATVTAETQAGGFTAACAVTVRGPAVRPASVSLGKPALSLAAGSSEQLAYTILPSDATNKSVTWTSSNQNVATVSQSGLVAALAAGTATITIATQDGNKTDSCVVTVGNASQQKPGTPIVMISGLNAGNRAITRHPYRVYAADPGGTATQFMATANNGGIMYTIGIPGDPFITWSSSNSWIYEPREAGDEIIYVKSRNAAGESDPFLIQVGVQENSVPRLGDLSWNGTTYGAMNLAVGQTASISLPASDADGDSVHWIDFSDGGLSGAKGSVALNGYSLVITIGEGSAVGDVYAISVRHSETFHMDDGNIWLIIGSRHEFNVNVVATSGGDWGEDFGAWGQGDTRAYMQSYPTGLDNLSRRPTGVPWIWQFNAGDPSFQNNRVLWWGVNGGRGLGAPVGDNAASSRSWIAQPRPQSQSLRPAFGALGDSFERWRMGVDAITKKPNNHQDNFPGGKMFFVSPEMGDQDIGLKEGEYYYKPSGVGSWLSFGVRADFEMERVIAYQNFYVQVSANAAPIVSGTAVGATLVLRSEADTSPSDSAKIGIGGLAVSDQDIVTYGDVLTFVLDGVTYGNNIYSAVGGALDVTGQIAKFLARPYPIEGIGIDAAKTYDGPIYGNGMDTDYYENSTGDRFTVSQNLYQYHRDGYNRRGNLNYSPNQNGTAVVLGPIEFVSVPKSSEIKRTPADTVGVTSEGLTFHYTVIDLGGNKVKFTIYVPTTKG